MTDAPPPPPDPRDPRDELYYDSRQRDDRDEGHGWQLLAIGLIALIIGAGAAYLITDASDTDPEVRTVQRERQTVTVQAAPPSATDAITVTQPPAETVTKTTTLTVTVPTVPKTVTEP